MNEGKTHWQGCWRHHHECAVKRLEEIEDVDASEISLGAILLKLLHQRDEAQIRLLGVLWKLVEDEVISESKARELANVSIEEWRRMLYG